MTQEDKKLLLKDLCARLPHGVIVQYKKKTFELYAKYIFNTKVEIDEMLHHRLKILDCKPYLRPMSSMTEYEKAWFNSLRNTITYQGNDKYDFDDFNELQDFLNRRHLDYRGLIPMGLGIEAPEGMYE